jgi:hypothetical protein
LHEATAAAQIRHPHAVAVLDVGVPDDGRPYIVYAYVRWKWAQPCPGRSSPPARGGSFRASGP